MAANNFIGTTNSNWNVSTNWSTGAVPLAGDGNVATFTNTSPACTINVASVCNNVDFTNYLHTITFTNTLTVSGNVTLGVGMSFSGSSALIVNASATLNSNGVTLGVPLTLNGNGISPTFTLSNAWIINGNFTTNGTAGGLTYTINGFSITCQKNCSINAISNSSSTVTTGSTTIIMVGTGTFSVANGSFNNNFTINATTNTVTISGNINYGTGIFTYTSGIISSTIVNLNIMSSCTIDTNSTTTNVYLPFNLTVNTTSIIITLNSNLYISGNYEPNSTTINGNNLIFQGNLSTSSGTSSGTAVLVFTGLNSGSVQTWSIGGTYTNSITFNTLGTVNITAAFTYKTGTITYTSGTINHSNTITISGSCTFNTNGMIFNNISTNITGTSNTITLNSLLSISGTFTHNTGGTLIFGGSSGFSIATFVMTDAVATNTITLTSSNTYIITTSFTMNKTAAIQGILNSSTPGTKSILTLNQGASQSISFIDATDIDSSHGQTIWCWMPVLSNTLNWNSLVASAMQTAYTFIN